MATGTRPSMRPPPLPFQRDSSIDSQKRNKENIRSPASPKSNGTRKGRTFIPSLVHSTDKADFFTDSYLADNNASPTSLIPSPLPQPAALARPRRKVRPAGSFENPSSRPNHRSTRSEISAQTNHHFQSTPQKPLARGTSPIRSIGLSTPPRSRDGSLNESPSEAQFSSPPRALTETYERIDQEEDLAATEGEISDPDSEPPRQNEVAMLANQGLERNAFSELQKPLPVSAGSTPTNPRFRGFGQRATHDDHTVASVLSDPTGMSFVDQLSDPNLRLAMTPHVVQSAADKEALRKIWDSKRPIAFGKANKYHLEAPESNQLTKDSAPVAPPRLIAFSKAGKRRLAGDLSTRPGHQRTFSDVTDRIEHTSQENGLPKHNDNWHNESLMREALPHNPRIHRDPYFSRTHGFPERQTNAVSNGLTPTNRSSRSESPATYAPHPLQVETQNRHESPGQATNRLSKINHQPVRDPNFSQSEPDLTLDRQLRTNDSSNVDWMEAAANEPVQSIETNYPPRSRSRLSDLGYADPSPDKSRRFDIDFTGQSFQVSESPPVRAKSLSSDGSRAKEIRGLAKRAVTTSRLSQLRARESLERMRQNSKSPVSETTADLIRELDADRDRLDDSPVIVYRSNSINNGKRNSNDHLVRPSPDRSQSHDLLQRLARGSSSTPRSTTPSEKGVNGNVSGNNVGQNRESRAASLNSVDEDDSTLQGPKETNENEIKATPRVTGAWTDTILPDTVRTAKQTGSQTKYAQTPHVSAGGWVETPAAPNIVSRLEPLIESTHEVPEELMEGIAKSQPVVENDPGVDDKTESKPLPQVPPQLAQSLAKKVLAEAKDKSRSRNEANSTNNADDSLAMGNVTMQSLQDLLDMDETDVTVFSKIGAEPLAQSDTEVLDRLGSKLDRLRTHIHEAKQGISNIESQISQPQPPAAPAPTTATQDHVHPTGTTTYFPLALLTMVLPIPLLFYPQPKSQPQFQSKTPPAELPRRLPFSIPQLRPTPFGWLIISIWTWYLLECTLAEIYAHPRYASSYIWPAQQEPEFPFVLPTILWRWSHLGWVTPYLFQPVITFIVGLIRMIAMSCGFTDGFSDGPGSANGILDEVQSVFVQTVQQSQVGAMTTGMDTGGGSGLYMMNDEIL